MVNSVLKQFAQLEQTTSNYTILDIPGGFFDGNFSSKATCTTRTNYITLDYPRHNWIGGTFDAHLYFKATCTT